MFEYIVLQLTRKITFQGILNSLKKDMMYVAWLKFLVVITLVTCARAERNAVCDKRYCKCSVVARMSISASCNITNMQDLRKYIKQPSLVTSLDISSNHISHITKMAFAGFKNLIFLNLSHNSLSTWSGNLTAQTPKLEIIDVTGNDQWLPGNNILVLESLKMIKGASWSNGCSQCTLVRNDSHHEGIKKLKDGEFIRGKKSDCRGMKHMVSNQLQTFANYGFYSSCFEEDNKCYSTLVKSIPIHRCWDIDNYILNIQFVFGPIALVLNSLVIIVTMTTPKLRKNPAMILVCNIAISDLCLSIYSILITSVRKMPYAKFYFIMDSLCPCVGFLWFMAQCVTVMTLVALTTERYLSIVYCMSPTVRLRQKPAVKCAALTWLVALIVATLPAVGVGVYTSNTYCTPFSRKRNIPHIFGFSIGISSVAILLYIATLGLYVRIYCFVKSSAIVTQGLRRKYYSVARKIAVMVGCNMFFFCLPVCIGLVGIASAFKRMDVITREIITGVVPTCAFTVNCMINPLLYAYRKNAFIKALKDKFKKMFSRKKSMKEANSLKELQNANSKL